MSRRDNQRAAEDAANRASEAGRVLQAQRQAAQSGVGEPSTEPAHVEPQPSGESPKPRNEPRRLAMEEIEARHHKTSGMEEPEPEPEAPEPKVEEKVTEPAPAETAASEPAAQPEAAAPVTEPAPEPVKTVRVKVDGEEFDAPQTDVEAAGGIHAYQRDKASDNRLKKANEALAQANRIHAEASQWRQQEQAKQPPKLTDDQFITSKMDLIRFGTQEEATVAFREVLDRNRIDQNALTARVAAVIQQQNAETQFMQEFSDLVQNPITLRTVIALKDERIRAGNLTGTWPSFYRALGNEVRSAFGRPSQPASGAAAPAAQQSSGTPSQAPTDKEARKASIVNLPTAAARAALPADSKPETREDILNEMRKSRGQLLG